MEEVEVVGVEAVEEEDPGFRVDLQVDLQVYLQVDLQVDLQAHLQVDLQEDLLLHHTTRHLLRAGQFPQQKPSMF